MSAGTDLDNIMDPKQVMAYVRDALHCESQAILTASARLDHSIVDAVQLLAECSGRLIITGMGKMGLIGRKAAATFNSTGAPAVFLHPADALHGDMGIVTDEDVVIALSNSGSTEEIIKLLPYWRRRGISLVGMTGNLESPLAKACDITIDTSVEREADPISVAPTASSTVALAFCDSLAIALMHVRGFTPEQFAEFHPGGNLGKKLLTLVGDLMRKDDQLPIIRAETRIREAIVTISEKGIGCAFAVDSNDGLVGIITDGDLRRIFQKHENPLAHSVSKYLSLTPATIQKSALAVEALRLIEQRSITVLPVIKNGRLVGAIHLHDLLAAGLA